MPRASLVVPLINRLWDSGRIADQGDASLIDRFLTGDRAERELAFETLVERHGPMVLAVCQGVLRDRTAAEDAFQATFLVLVRRIGTIRHPERLGPWLHGVALRVSKESRRLARRRVRPNISAEPVNAAVSQSESLERQEAFAALHQEIGCLPDTYRVPLILCELEGLSHGEAASRLGSTAGAIDVRLHRARAMLRVRLSRRGFQWPAVLGLASPGPFPWEAPDCQALFARTVREAIAIAAKPGLIQGVVYSLAQGAVMTLTLKTSVKWALVLLLSSVALLGVGFALQPRAATHQAPMVPSIQVVKGDPTISFDDRYRLGDGEVIKLVAPPFPAERLERIKASGFSDDKVVVGFRQDPTDKGSPRLKWIFGFASDASHSQNLATLLSSMLPIDPSRVVDDTLYRDQQGAMQVTKVSGDWVVRKGATMDQVVAGLNAILRVQFQPSLRLTFNLEERDVIVAKGKYVRKLWPTQDAKADGGDPRILIFGPEPPPPASRIWEGSFLEFLHEVGQFFEPQQAIVSDAEGVPDRPIRWALLDRDGEAGAGRPRREDHDAEAILRHLSAQTGLEFVRERRAVPVLHLKQVRP